LFDKVQFKYVLLGYISSDPLESRFGWYRQLSGGNYFLSVRQLLQSERKIKALSLLKYSKFSVKEMPIVCSNFDEEKVNQIGCELFQQLQNVTDADLDYDDYNILYFICGYIARAETRLRKCDSCKLLLVPSGRFVCVPIL
jgi:hypothetical protein